MHKLLDALDLEECIVGVIPHKIDRVSAWWTLAFVSESWLASPPYLSTIYFKSNKNIVALFTGLRNIVEYSPWLTNPTAM
jgi:hypothetical protein